MNKICFALSSILLVSVILSSPSIKASPVDQNIQAATEAYKKGSYADAARLFAAAAEELAKAKNPQAALLWGNAALAMLKGENYQAVADIYEKLLTGKQQIPQDKLLQFYINSIVCYTKLKQPAMRIASIDSLLKKFPKLKPVDLAELYASQGDAYFDMELYAPALASYDKAIAKLPSSENPELRMRILGALGECQRTLGYYSEAKKTLSEAEKAAEKLKDPKILAEAKSKLGVLHTEMGDYPEALKRLSDALATEQKAGLRLHEGSEKNNIGQVYLYTGNHEKAMNHFEEGISIAREVGNKKGQAIATINRALLNRIAGNHAKARADYKEGAKLFKECGMKEGQAVTMLGIGKMAELADRNNVEALENYEQALDIFRQLEQPRWQAVSLLLLGDLHKKMKKPGRTTRDLVFDEEPTNPEISEEDALNKSRAYYEQALKMGEDLAADEIIWAAHQGLGFSDYNAGKLESALEHYQQAINIVSNMFLDLQDVQMLGEYMASKEDLYNESIEICLKLYDKTGDNKYLDLIARYKQTLANEINKANTALVKLDFENKDKQNLFERLQELGKKKNQAAKNVPAVKDASQDASTAERHANALVKKVAADQRVQVKKLDSEYSKLLKEWQKKYPEDADIFSASADRVNIYEIQKALLPNQAVLQYVPLKGNKNEPGKLLIIGIKKDATQSFSVNIGENDLRKLILDEFVVGYIHNGFKRYIRDEKTGNFARDKRGQLVMGEVNYDPSKNEEYFNKSVEILSKLYSYLVEPVHEFLSGVERIYFIVDGFLSQIPFNMLVCGREADGVPEFLVEKYQVSTIRLVFLEKA